MNNRNNAESEIVGVLNEIAGRRATIFYSELAERIQSANFFANDKRMHDLLGEISRDSDAEGHGMLSVVVINKKCNLPGLRFFELAKELGRDVSDERSFWKSELQKVYDGMK